MQKQINFTGTTKLTQIVTLQQSVFGRAIYLIAAFATRMSVRPAYRSMLCVNVESEII